jgi:prepilin-type N-terminal cleavage/methylation domain-containing protein
VKLISRHNSAFTLVEVIIGIAILSIVMSSITVLTIISIQANQANVNRLTAYYLAQEGVEGLRNMRDSNWLQNYGWDADSGWGIDFEADGYYKIDYLPGGDPPWELTYGGNDLDVFLGSDLMLYLANDGGHVFYVNNTASWSDYSASRYNRYLHITHDVDGEDILEVTAVVFWDDHGNERDVQVSTLLTDWREGPI